MDQDLKAYLDQNFSSINRRLEETGQQIQILREETLGRFQETGQQIQALREETNQRFERVEDRLETGVREVHIAVEGLRGEIRLVADGVANVNERLDRYQEKVSQELADIKSSNQLSYKDLRRSQVDLESRVRKSEAAG